MLVLGAAYIAHFELLNECVHTPWTTSGGGGIGDESEKKKPVPGKGVPFLCLSKIGIINQRVIRRTYNSRTSNVMS
jgi:hypothetical protein